MKYTFRIMLVVVMATLTTTFVGCLKDEEDKVEEFNQVFVNPEYVPIDWQTTTVIVADDSAGTYQFQFTDRVPDIHTGSIITIDRDTAVLYRYVISSSVSGNNLSVTTTEAYLTDIFANTDFTLATDDHSKPKSKGSVYYPVEAYLINEDGDYWPLDMKHKGETRFTHNLWNSPNFNMDGQVLFSAENCSIYMERMNFSLGLDLEMYMNFGGRNRLEVVADAYERYRSQAMKVSAALIGKFDTEQIIRCDVDGDFSYSPDYDLWKHNLFRPVPIKFVVEGVPIVITMRCDLFRQVQASGSGRVSAYTGVTDHAEGRLGFEWQQTGSIIPVASFDNTLELTPPTLEGKGQLQAKVWAFPRVSVMLYDALGPSFDFMPYLADTVRGGFREQILGSGNDYCAWSLDCHAGIDLRVGLSQRFFGYEVENQSTPVWKWRNWRLYHSPKRIVHASGRSSVGESEAIRFNVYDQNYLFNTEVLTPLPQIVKFEAGGQLSSEYSIVHDGMVSVTWTPIANDVLYARLYDMDGNVIAWDTVNLQPSGDWVDLGLPSGLLWAEDNLGANSPEEYGDYYAWGETQTKSVYEWSTYAYAYGGASDQLTKYCNNSSYGYNGYTDSRTILEASDDAATARLGNGARIPTADEWRELINNTTSEWTTQNGVYGLRFTAANGNSLFLPAAGGRYGSELSYAGSIGNYWSASLFAFYPRYAWCFGFGSDDQSMYHGNRYYGFSVRAVRASQN